MQPFAEAGYLAQARRLRRLASRALALYPISVRSVDFLNHGENATFRIEDGHGRRYLLRVHRPDYHTPAAIEEEALWLEHIAAGTGLAVPVPVRSTAGRSVRLAAPGPPATVLRGRNVDSRIRENDGG